MATIVTLTCYPEIFQQFARSADEFEHDTRKIVVTSGLELAWNRSAWEIVTGIEPFIFARNANLGIWKAGQDDVVLVNDDVQFRSLDAVTKLSEVAHSFKRVGILSPQLIGGVGNRLQNRRTELDAQVTLTSQRLAFTCVYIKRALIDSIGFLDERFSGYGCEDDDYCLRARKAGWELAVTPEVVVRHGFGERNATSSFCRCPHCKGTGCSPELEESAERMREVFAKKWGHRP